mgnify:CR=1 FL=1
MKEPRRFGGGLFVLSLAPFLYVAGGLASDIVRRTRVLGSNPIQEAEHQLGEWALRFLVLTLLVTPLRRTLGWNWLAKHRRTLGLFAFGYALSHWLVYVLIDRQLDLQEILTDVSKRPYILLGTAALLLMLPLALTSTARMIARLGGRRWNLLHRLVYPAAVAGTAHFWLSKKSDVREPMVFATVFALLFLWRLWKARGNAAPPRHADPAA